MTDPYASEEETRALIRKDVRTPAMKQLDAMLEARGASEMGADAGQLMYEIALQLLEAKYQIGVDTVDGEHCVVVLRDNGDDTRTVVATGFLDIQPQCQPLTGEVLVRAAQHSLSPHQYDHFEALLENDTDAHNRLARSIVHQLESSNG